MRRRHEIGALVLATIALFVTSTGCTHNHYYYTQPGVPAGVMGVPATSAPCDPPLSSGTVISSARPVMTTPAVGAVCDEPPQGSLASRAPATTPMPIYSQPGGNTRRRGGLAWRSSNTESLASTRVEGAYDDDSTFK